MSSETCTKPGPAMCVSDSRIARSIPIRSMSLIVYALIPSSRIWTTRRVVEVDVDSTNCRGCDFRREDPGGDGSGRRRIADRDGLVHAGVARAYGPDRRRLGLGWIPQWRHSEPGEPGGPRDRALESRPRRARADPHGPRASGDRRGDRGSRRRVARPAGVHRRLTNGLTNANYRVNVDGEAFVVRIPGASTEFLAIDRANELHNARGRGRARHRPRRAPPLPGERCDRQEFLHGRPMTKPRPGVRHARPDRRDARERPRRPALPP